MTHTAYERELQNTLENYETFIFSRDELSCILKKFYMLGLKVESGKPVQQPALFKGK